MANRKCCICGTIKNCGPYLEKVLQNIDKIATLFDEYVVIFAYDHSSDNSLELLENYKNSKNSKNTNVIIDINTDPVNELRVYNIAKARNKCLDIIRDNFVSYDYFIMIYCDDVSTTYIKLEPLK